MYGCMEVIEHFEKEEGMKLIEKMEGIARKQVIITTPVGFWRQKSISWEENVFQKHVSSYYPYELKELSYNVRGQGVRKIYDARVFFSSHYYLRKTVGRVLRVIFNPFSYYFPSLGENMICIKKMDGFSNKELGR